MTNQSDNRRWHNRPQKHTTSKIDNNWPIGTTLQTQFELRKDGLIGRRYTFGRHGEPYTDPVCWRQLQDGRQYITHEGKKLYAHYLRWLLVHGNVPKQIRFRDGDKSNHSIDNLTASLPKRTYQARVRVGDKIRCLGSYVTHEEAVAAQDAFKALVNLGIV